jgi:ElaB/YqjD/DUF883 family membrane-anchored ribosome-binding protein
MNNPVKTMGDDASKLLHEAAEGAEQAIRSTQRAAQHGLDSARAQTTSALNHLGQDAESLAQRGMDAAHEGSHKLQEKSMHARDVTTNYIQREPVKSMLMAAAVGAALMGLVALLSRQGGSGR